MKRRAFLSASAAAPLAGITAALPFTGAAASEGGAEFSEIQQLFGRMTQKQRAVITGCARLLAEKPGKRAA